MISSTSKLGVKSKLLYCISNSRQSDITLSQQNDTPKNGHDFPYDKAYCENLFMSLCNMLSTTGLRAPPKGAKISGTS